MTKQGSCRRCTRRRREFAPRLRFGGANPARPVVQGRKLFASWRRSAATEAASGGPCERGTFPAEDLLIQTGEAMQPSYEDVPAHQLGEVVAAAYELGTLVAPDRTMAADLAARHLERMLVRSGNARLVAAVADLARELAGVIVTHQRKPGQRKPGNDETSP
jgi:hypothetical protein